MTSHFLHKAEQILKEVASVKYLRVSILHSIKWSDQIRVRTSRSVRRLKKIAYSQITARS